MRWFSAFFHALNRLLLCYTLIIMYVTYVHSCILNNNIVYANMCMFWYKDIQCYIVYMNSMIRLCVRKVRSSHVCIEQAKLFSYSLPYIYEQPKLWTTSQTIMRRLGCLNVWLYGRYVQSNLEKRSSLRIFTL